MDNIKEALQYVVELSKPEIINVDGIDYSDKPIAPIIYNPKARSIELNTLTSLVDYIKSGVDDLSSKMIIQVVSPTQVLLYSSLDLERERENVIEVNALIPKFPWERYISHEEFCIALQAKFVSDPQTDKELVLKFAGTVEDGTVAEYGDDGITQKATVKTGIASKTDAVVPNPVRLKPYRTFMEIEQPISDFIFRMKSRDSIECALFEADGGAWKNEAMWKIQTYLEKEINDKEHFIIIA